jgi:acyl transferase domain-containing protein
MDIMGMDHHGFLSPDGKCYSFDHRANGYARGEGVGSIVVKRLSYAIRDGNTIRAVIRGFDVNQGDRTAGITLPSARAQENLIRSRLVGLSSDSYAGLVFWDAGTWVYPSILALHLSHASTINNY